MLGLYGIVTKEIELMCNLDGIIKGEGKTAFFFSRTRNTRGHGEGTFLAKVRKPV